MKFLKPFYKNKYQDKDLPFVEFYKEHKKELESMGVSEEDISEARNGSFNIKIDTEKFDIPESYIISKQLIVVRSWEGWANHEGVEKNIIPNKLPEYSEEFFEGLYSLPTELKYENGVKLNKEQIEEALFSRVYKSNFTKIVIKNFFTKMSFYSDEDMKNHTDDFVRAMVKHKAYEGVIDGEDMFEDLLEEGLTEEFIQYYSERRGISKQQRYCDHDNMDTFSADGMFYNYVGDCNKCLLESKNNPQEDDENMVEMFEVWQDARKKADKELLDHLGYAANQLEGVSVAIEAHGTNINPAFFIKEYKEMADEKREIIKKYKEED